MAENRELFLVSAAVLPEAVKKTIRGKEMLRMGRVRTINEAVKKVNVSRSAFYKYKDDVFPYDKAGLERIITLYFSMDQDLQSMSNVISYLAAEGAQLEFINQGLPVQGQVGVAMAVDMSDVKKETELFLDELRKIDGVTRLQVLDRR